MMRLGKLCVALAAISLAACAQSISRTELQTGTSSDAIINKLNAPGIHRGPVQTINVPAVDEDYKVFEAHMVVDGVPGTYWFSFRDDKLIDFNKGRVIDAEFRLLIEAIINLRADLVKKVNVSAISLQEANEILLTKAQKTELRLIELERRRKEIDRREAASRIFLFGLAGALTAPKQTSIQESQVGYSTIILPRGIINCSSFGNVTTCY